MPLKSMKPADSPWTSRRPYSSVRLEESGMQSVLAQQSAMANSSQRRMETVTAHHVATEAAEKNWRRAGDARFVQPL